MTSNTHKFKGPYAWSPWPCLQFVCLKSFFKVHWDSESGYPDRVVGLYVVPLPEIVVCKKMFYVIVGVSLSMPVAWIWAACRSPLWWVKVKRPRKEELNEHDRSLDIVESLGLAEWNRIGINKITKGMAKINNNQIPENQNWSVLLEASKRRF